MNGHGDGGQSTGPPKKPPNSTFNRGRAQNPVCQICKKLGHTTATCWFKSAQTGTLNSFGRGPTLSKGGNRDARGLGHGA